MAHARCSSVGLLQEALQTLLVTYSLSEPANIVEDQLPSLLTSPVAMGAEAQPLHILFFPFMAPGHMNPMVDIAKLFTRRGVKATILTTPANVSLIQPTIDCANQHSDHNLHPISIVTLPFPGAEAGLPPGCENFLVLPSLDHLPKFLRASTLLRQPFDELLTDLAPDCVISDMFFPWTQEVAAEHGLPRLVFDGMSFFYHCATDSLQRHKPLENSPPEAETFVLPGLPHHIQMLKSQIQDFRTIDSAVIEFFIQAKVSELQSYGKVVNSFYELEPEYAEHYKKVLGGKAWHVGPVSLCNKDEVNMSCRGDTDSIDNKAFSDWLQSKARGSVVYVSLGSLSDFPIPQLQEIALGLEASNHPFIWAIRTRAHNWLPEGFEERNKGRGMVVKWAPQVFILNHPAVGGFLTHCGWNSTLEGLSAGVPLATCPLFADQFYNERMIVDVLTVGVSVGVKKYVYWTGEGEEAVVAATQIKKAVDELMGSGEEAGSRRRKAKLFGERAQSALGEGGSSYIDIGNLIEELKDKRPTKESGNPCSF